MPLLMLPKAVSSPLKHWKTITRTKKAGGKNDKESIAQVTVLRPDGYLLKTIPPDKIVKAIDDFFEKKKGEHIV